jgi:hypothetical protein
MKRIGKGGKKRRGKGGGREKEREKREGEKEGKEIGALDFIHKTSRADTR